LSAQINLNVEKTVLDNGLTILTCEDHSFPTVSYQTFVNAGSRDELRAGASGVAHVCEHMMFRGTPRHPDYDEAVSHMGPQTNAYTGQDYTCYYINARAEFLPEIIAVEADRIRNLRFTQEIFNREMGPIREERRRFVADHPDGYLEEQIYKLSYNRHTYEHPVIGWENDVEKNLSFRDANDFFNLFYAPNFVTIIIAGNFDTHEALNLIQEYYGDWPSSLPPIGRIRAERDQNRERKLTLTWKSSEIPGKLAIAYHGPDLNYTENDILSLQVLARLLFSSSGSLHKMLKNELKLVESISADMKGKKDPGLFLIWADLADPAYLDSTLQIIYAEIERVKNEGVPEEELTGTVNTLKAEYIYRLDRPSRIVGSIGFCFLTGGDHKLMFNFYDRISALTVDDLKSAARKYLFKKNRNVVSLMPKATGEGGS
jgi:zinc protease